VERIGGIRNTRILLCVDSAFDRNDHQECLLGDKAGRCVVLTSGHLDVAIV